MLLLDEGKGEGNAAPGKSLVDYGLDSMLAAELGGVMHGAASVDVSFAAIMANGTTI